MKNINKHLQYIQEETIQEVDPVTIAVGSLGGAALLLIGQLVLFLLMGANLTRSIKVDKPLSKRINNILKSGDKWIVHIYATKEPNAFSLGMGRHIFITSKLHNLLTDTEADAVLLHEVYHSSKKHAYKQLAYNYPLFSLMLFVFSMAVTLPTALPLAMLILFTINHVGKIAYNVTIGRKMEYNADSFAAKNGYGKELISAFNKMKFWAESKMKNQTCGKICQLVNKIDRAIDEHPSDKKRIENILRHTKELSQALKSKSFKKIKAFVTKFWGR